MREYDVFISHSTDDAKTTEYIVTFLEKERIRLWISSSDT